MNSAPPSLLVKWLRAAGEPSRLRLLMLCSERALSVSDLGRAVKQSEPRVSRHLKILCEAGLLERLRQGQWVHYRLAQRSEPASFVRGLLAQLDQRDPQLLTDRSGSRELPARAPQAAGPGAESRLGRALAAFLASARTEPAPAAALIVGVQHLELLESAAAAAQRCTAIAHSRRAAQSARAFAERRGFACRVLQASSDSVIGAADLLRAGDSFDSVVLDHPLIGAAELAAQLQQVRHIVAPGARVWVFERYEALEGSRERVVEHPLARLRRLLGDHGLSCERLSPIEADHEHVLAAVAVPAANREQPTLRHA
jgi:DNA-binding transcriptional ArsR family regulator